MGCNRTTVYLSGSQVSLSDIKQVWIEGVSSTPQELASYQGRAHIRVESRFGFLELDFDSTAAHGRAGRSIPDLTNPVLAALALSNQVIHEIPGESLPHAKRVARAALKSVSSGDLLTLLSHPSATSHLKTLGGPVFKLRNLRLAPSGTPFIPSRDPDAEFERRAASQSAGKPTSWTQASALAQIDGRRFINDRHPMVRVAAMYGLREAGLKSALVQDRDAMVRRNAAHVLTGKLNVPLSQEGRLAGRTAAPKADVLFLDIDGTICQGANLIDQESVRLLKLAQQRGLVVVAVTGRSADAFSLIGFEPDLACTAGTLWDPVSGMHIADVTDKADAVAAVCALLGTSSIAAVGDGEVDTPMFRKVREVNGPCGWPITGQAGPSALATDLLGGVGSGSVGRFALDVLAGTPRSSVPDIQPLKAARTNYTAQLIARTGLEALIDESMLPQDWEMAHGHVTLAYPQRGASIGSLPLAAPNADVRVLGRVRSSEVTTFVVEVDGQREQADGSPLHVTVGLGRDASGKRVAPVLGNRATAKALAEGTVEWFDEPRSVRSIPASAGSFATRMDRDVEDAVVAANASQDGVRRAVAAGLKEDLLRANHQVGPTAMHDPVSAAISQGGHLEKGLVVLSGIPASGKSTVARQLADKHNAVVVCLDDIRAEVNGSAGDQSNLQTVLAVAKARIEAELALGRLVVSDATNVEARVLRELIDTAHRNDLPAVIACVDVSREVALERDLARHNRGERALGNSLPGRTPQDPWNEAHASMVIDKMLDRQVKVSKDLAADRLGADAVIQASLLLAP